MLFICNTDCVVDGGGVWIEVVYVINGDGGIDKILVGMNVSKIMMLWC